MQPGFHAPLAAGGPAARCARIRDRRPDQPLQGGHRPRLQGLRAEAAGGHPPPLRPAAGRCPSASPAPSRWPTGWRPSSRRRSWPASRWPRPTGYFGMPRGVPEPLRERLDALDAVSVARGAGAVPGPLQRAARGLRRLPYFRHYGRPRTSRTHEPIDHRRSRVPRRQAACTSARSAPIADGPRCGASHLMTCLHDDVRADAGDASSRAGTCASSCTTSPRRCPSTRRPMPSNRRLIDFARDWGGHERHGGALLGRHQPLHGGRLHRAVRRSIRTQPEELIAQPTARGLADRLSQPADGAAGR